jgi:hypothetical protein
MNQLCNEAVEWIGNFYTEKNVLVFYQMGHIKKAEKVHKKFIK